jgi:hypothetical protein
MILFLHEVKLTIPTRVTLSYHPAWSGKTASEMSAENARVAGVLAERLGMYDDFRERLTKIMDSYYESLGRGLNDMSFDVDRFRYRFAGCLFGPVKEFNEVETL